MVTDYTETTTKPKAESEWICKECYEISDPIYSQQGHWPKYLAQAFVIMLLILVPSLIWLAILFILGIFTFGFVFQFVEISIFPLAKHLPAQPSTVAICRHCGDVNRMVRLDDTEGQQALHWHRKEKMIPQNSDK